MTPDARERLLDAVERLCVEKPFSLVTMRMIAEEAEVSVGLAYYDFESKDDLVGQAVDRMSGRIAARAIDPEPGSELEQIWAGIAWPPPS